jgi:hypothetical protein
MTADPSIDPVRFLAEHLERAEPDLLRAMLKTFVDALMGPEADALCGARMGAVRGGELRAAQVVAGQRVLALHQPIPPPSVSPATPVLEISLPVLARPCSAVAASKSAQMAPGCTIATRRSASTATPRSADRSMTTPPSQLDSAATLWLPARTANGTPASRVRAMAAATSSTVRQRAISPGLAVTAPFQPKSAARSARSVPIEAAELAAQGLTS